MTYGKWLKSKTMWSAVFIAGLGALEVNIGVIPAEYRGHVLIAVSMLMAGLRFVTTKPLSDK
jgi:hypothetical protein